MPSGTASAADFGTAAAPPGWILAHIDAMKAYVDAVRDNVVTGNQKAGIVFGGFKSSVGRVKNSSFLNNTCYQNDTAGAGFGVTLTNLSVMRSDSPIATPIVATASIAADTVAR